MIAELRLGQILLYQQQFDEALALLSSEGAGAFAGQYYELRGDIYYEMARYSEARDEYNLALSSPAEGVISRELVSMKLDDATGLLVSAEVAVADSEIDNDNAADLPVADADNAANE
jgi:predicted negative regulator of RcsB-dependent stress response